MTLKNTGYIASDYTVGVVHCSAGVRPIQASLESGRCQEARPANTPFI